MVFQSSIRNDFEVHPVAFSLAKFVFWLLVDWLPVFVKRVDYQILRVEALIIRRFNQVGDISISRFLAKAYPTPLAV